MDTPVSAETLPVELDSQHYVAYEKLRDGRDIVIRSIRPEDKPVLQEGMHHLSRESLYFRFFTGKTELSEKELTFFTEIDFIHHVGLLASLLVSGAEAVPIGVGRYIMTDRTKALENAELAFAVDEKFQGLGVGTHLMKHLTKIGRAQGLKKFTAFVLPQNIKMQAVFMCCGLPMTQVHNDAGVLEMTLSLE